MKSYTSLEQSKTLSTILPSESADMFIADVISSEEKVHSYNFHILSTWGCNTFEELKNRENNFVHFIPVWSFTTLLRVIPKRIKNVNVLRIDIDEENFSIWYDEVGCGVNTNLPDITMECPIDACYEMILKLYELRML